MFLSLFASHSFAAVFTHSHITRRPTFPRQTEYKYTHLHSKMTYIELDRSNLLVELTI